MMTSAQKFLFDTDFGEPLEAKTKKAKEKEAPPEPPPPPTFSEAEMAQARTESEAAGHKKGLAEAQQSIEERTAKALEQLGEQIKALFDDEQNTVEEAKRDAVAVAAAVAVKMFPGLNRRHGVDEVTYLVADILERLREEPKVAIRISEEDSEAMVEHIEALSEGLGFEGRLTVLSDETLGAGDCRIEWNDGGAERDSKAMWRQIDEIVERYLSEAEAEAEAESESDAEDETEETEGDEEDKVEDAAPDLPETETETETQDVNP
ncbi:FliH/SctL family protein [Magnetospira thiophila]